MYPELLPPLLVGLGIAAGFVAFLVIRRPVLRKLALRQVVRRPTEALLVVLGSVLGTALIVASLVVGDSLDRSVRQVAYDVLGPVDEYVRSPSVWQGGQVASRLQSLTDDPQVDGVLPAVGDSVAAVREVDGRRTAEPRALAWELDFADAAKFGAPHASGLDVKDPGPGNVVINQNLADQLDARTGDRITFYVYGSPMTARVSAVVPAEGLAGIGVGASSNRDAFFSPGTITAAAQAVRREPMSTAFVSNRGGVEDGVKLTDAVSAKMRTALGSLTTQGASVSTPKREVLDQAEQTGAILGSLFLFIGSFSIIAGVLLLVNVFVMLADERKGQLGVLRAIGLRRRRVTAEFAIEGSVYAGIAALLGALLGLAVARVVVVLAVHILNGFNQSENQLAIVFHVTPTSLLNGIAAGFLIALAAVVVTSIRIARVNIIAAIRDLEPQSRPKTRKRLAIASVVATVLFVALSVPAIAASDGPTTYLFPTLAAIAALPLLARVMPPGRALTVVALAILGWGLLANVVRPHMYDDASTASYVVLGCMLSFAAVTLVSQHQSVLLRPLSPLVNRPSQTGLATRLAIAYPTAKRFRTGATLAMYSVVVLVIILLTQISAIVDAGVDKAVNDATAIWGLRVDYNPNTPLADPARDVTTGRFAGRVTAVAPLVVAPAQGSDPLHRTSDPLPVVAVGISPELAANGPDVDTHLASLPDGAATWALVLRDPKYVLVDGFYGAPGGPQGEPVHPGSTLTLTDPRTG
jgi:putative ABC transport system permease protein